MMTKKTWIILGVIAGALLVFYLYKRGTFSTSTLTTVPSPSSPPVGVGVKAKLVDAD